MAGLMERYAAALFGMSIESHMEQAILVRDVLQDEQCQNILMHPRISKTAKREFLKGIFADKISGELLDFLYNAVSENHEALLVPTLTMFIDMGKRYSRKVIAKVVSAMQLNERQIHALQTILTKKLDKKVEIQVQTDPALMGGFYVQVEGRLFDGTVKTQLNNMKESLMREDAG